MYSKKEYLSMQNSGVAESFEIMADLLEITGENPFRIRAYRNAARTIRSMPQDLGELVKNSVQLSDFPGIGKDLASKIEELYTTGHLEVLDNLEKKISPELVNLMRITGLGGKRVALIHNKLGLNTIDQLESAAKEHRICQLPGLGEKIEESIILGIEQFKVSIGRYLLADAEQIADSFVQYLKNNNCISQITIAGSFRRRKETVRDIDILVTGSDNICIMDYFLKYPHFNKIISKGETRSTAVMRSGMQIDIRVVPDECFGSALHYFTGSQSHNISIRKRGIKYGLKINEYGIYKANRRIGGLNEIDVFNAVGLEYIEPELREDQGEIEAAERSDLPELISIKDIKGDLHAHTIATDGHATIEQMASAAMQKGYSYLAITDHSQRLAMTHGLSERDLAEQIEAIDRLNLSFENFKILKSCEVDILENGELDIKDSILKLLDLTVCSIHTKLNLSKKQQTARVLKAMENPYFTILAHPTGRLINRRPPYEIDLEQIMYSAKEKNKILEINSFPDRMDLDATYCRRAKHIGVKVAISTDAHGLADLNFMKYGIGQARRGWLEASDVINTYPLSRLLKILIKK
jgi:DNA polymerase (family X)